jgi:seryl-tRNA(Sec) selenium transferase
MPTSQIPSIAISVNPTGISLNKLSHALRTGTPAIVGYTDTEKLCLDLRTIFPWQDEAVATQLQKILS